MSDPKVYRYSGLRPFAPEGDDLVRAISENPDRALRRTIVTPLYVTYESLAGVYDSTRHRAFFVMRDPRDVLISRYFSRLSAHPKNERIMKERERLKALSVEEGLISIIDDFGKVTAIMRSWKNAENSPGVLLTRFEDLTAQDNYDAWEIVFRHCGISLPPRLARELLSQYSFARISGGRSQGEEDASHKYRKGVAGDWQNHFTPAVLKHFDHKTGGLVAELGYR